jgi:hypothetical protein
MASQRSQRLNRNALNAKALAEVAPAIPVEVISDDEDANVSGDEDVPPQPLPVAGSSMVGQTAEPKSAF